MCCFHFWGKVRSKSFSLVCVLSGGRVLEGNRQMTELPGNVVTSAADLFVNHHEEVLERLQRRNPSADFADLSDAFLQALFELADAPDKYNPHRGSSVTDFLVGASQRRLLTLLRSDRRRRAREEKVGRAVADEASAARDPLDKLDDAEWVKRAQDVAQDDRERRVLDFWALDYSDAEIAEKLDLPPQEVRRIRDRLTKRLARLNQDTQDDAEK